MASTLPEEGTLAEPPNPTGTASTAGGGHAALPAEGISADDALSLQPEESWELGSVAGSVAGSTASTLQSAGNLLSEAGQGSGQGSA